ncbi:hypothetical protein P171DRAFT_279121 [Karstenula rhodostoma CBS 690.94]|uniref:Secreted protein n=1 Tax=Karstenula rhodostoma CBS 690.94 TaxID=1392251 RepID=A0A9P4UCY4_9PLEO|nr:hypothetical protein P171DRAFT_279121 [Karstenula rhodostoma CBS 690.94]
MTDGYHPLCFAVGAATWLWCGFAQSKQRAPRQSIVVWNCHPQHFTLTHVRANREGYSAYIAWI